MSFTYSSTLPLINPDFESGGDLIGKKQKSSSGAIQILLLLVLLAFGIAILVAVPSIHEPLLRMTSVKITSLENVKDGGSYPLAGLKNLVMVAGHAIYNSTTCGDSEDNDSWTLLPYQANITGQAESFVQHIKVGVEVAEYDKDALLLFSGGETRQGAGPRSEAQSYWYVAEAKGWFDRNDVRRRALTEENGRDSFENLLFSVCRFKELTGIYPQKITVVSYDFKGPRFVGEHCKAIRFPNDKCFFVGTPLPAEAMPGAIKGENSTVAKFKEDPYGCKADGELRSKRLQRDPFHRTVPYPAGCPELTGLFEYCGNTIYAGALPWGQQ